MSLTYTRFKAQGSQGDRERMAGENNPSQPRWPEVPGQLAVPTDSELAFATRGAGGNQATGQIKHQRTTLTAKQTN